MSKVRVRLRQGQCNQFLQATLEILRQRSKQELSFTVDEWPLSVNHQYIHTRFNTRLRPEVEAFRWKVRLAIGSKRLTGEGLLAAVIVLYGPMWVTKRLTVREADADNRVKPILDAIEKATDIEDERFFQVHVFKYPARKTYATVHIFDTGDVVDYHGL